MTKNNSSQISIFMDNHIRFKISNEFYSIKYKNEVITFSELESIIRSNLKYWNTKNEESEMCTEILGIWNVWSELVKRLKGYLEQEDELIAEKLYNFMYNNFSSNPIPLSDEIKLYQLNIDSPIDKDSEIAMIRVFIDYYLNSVFISSNSFICFFKDSVCVSPFLIAIPSSKTLKSIFFPTGFSISLAISFNGL